MAHPPGSRLAEAGAWQICKFASLSISQFAQRKTSCRLLVLDECILLDIVEYIYGCLLFSPAWFFYSPLARQAARLKDDLLDPVDQLLHDPALLDLVRQCLAKRSPRSTRTGRMGMAPDRLLRCCVMKHLD